MSNILPALAISSAGAAVAVLAYGKLSEQADAWNSRAESLPAGDPNKAAAASRAGQLTLVQFIAPLLISGASIWAAVAIAKS